MGVALVAWVGSGVFIFYNTNILNRYRPQPDYERGLADAEKELLPFESLTWPRLVGVALDVQLFPKQTRAVTKGTYRVVNRSAQPIEQIHLGWNDRLRIDALTIDGATLEKEYPQYFYRIYRFSRRCSRARRARSASRRRSRSAASRTAGR